MQRTSHRSQSDRLYFINVARNIARDGATTHFIFASDVELFPSRNLVPQFLRMIALGGSVIRDERMVYVLPPFEVTEDSKPPENKTQLQQMLQNQVAIRFHRNLCDKCHRIPNNEIWEANLENRGEQLILIEDFSLKRPSTCRLGSLHFGGSRGTP